MVIAQFLPDNVQVFISREHVQDVICELTKTKGEFVQKSVNHLLQTLQAWKEHGYIQGFQGNEYRNKLDGMMEDKFINYNISKLGKYYEDILTQDEIDERCFVIREDQPQSISMTPFMRQSQQRLQNQRILNYDTNENVNMSANLKDISILEHTPQQKMQQKTPNNHTNYLNESQAWFEDHIYKVQTGFDGVMTNNLKLIFNKCDPLIFEINKQRLTQNYKIITQELEEYFQFTNQEEKSLFHLEVPRINSKTEQILLLYIRILEELLKQESKRKEQINFQALMENERLHKAIIACSFETVLFISNVCFISFERLLKVIDVSCFDFWKLTSSFLQFDQKMPHYLKRHFRDIELKILCQLAWKSDSTVQQMLSKYIAFQEQQSRQQEINLQDKQNMLQEQCGSERHASFDMFFRRVLHCAAHKVMELTDVVNLSDKLKEQC